MIYYSAGKYGLPPRFYSESLRFTYEAQDVLLLVSTTNSYGGTNTEIPKYRTYSQRAVRKNLYLLTANKKR